MTRHLCCVIRDSINLPDQFELRHDAFACGAFGSGV
jgi:hypothetical protein